MSNSRDRRAKTPSPHCACAACELQGGEEGKRRGSRANGPISAGLAQSESRLSRWGGLRSGAEPSTSAPPRRQSPPTPAVPRPAALRGSAASDWLPGQALSPDWPRRGHVGARVAFPQALSGQARSFATSLELALALERTCSELLVSFQSPAAAIDSARGGVPVRAPLVSASAILRRHYGEAREGQ